MTEYSTPQHHDEGQYALDPHTPIAIYDDECNVCTAIKDWAERRQKRPVYFMGLRDPRMVEFVPGIDVEKARESFSIREWDGRIYHGANASARLLARLKQPWAFFGRLFLLPPLTALAEPVYRFVANNRPEISKTFNFFGVRLYDETEKEKLDID